MGQITSMSGNVTYLNNLVQQKRTDAASGGNTNGTAIVLLRRTTQAARLMAAGDKDNALMEMYNIRELAEKHYKSGKMSKADFQIIQQQYEVMDNAYCGRKFSFNA